MKKAIDAVERHRQLILDAERYIWKNPETGYKEYKTSKYMEEHFEALGYELVKADGITGFYTQIDTGCEGPELLILGELDSIICPEHPECDPETGAVHACGHNAQCATLLGIAAALKEPGMLDGLCGKIRLCAVPAEELLEIGYRTELKKQGKIKYFGGKSEFLHRGYFDGVDLAFMVHTGIGNFAVTNGSIGCLAKRIVYKGTASHAGGSPWTGNNALYAATCGINAVNAIRETFRDSNLIRVHPIVTHGGDMVNAIPARVELESYVRGGSFDAIVDANKRVNRALTGAALSLGCNVEIIDTPGYAPMYDDRNFKVLAQDAFKEIAPDIFFEFNEHVSTGSTDMGDLSCIMPTIQPYAPGARGEAHGKTYEIFDPESACVTNAKWQVAMALLLLQNGAERAKQIIAEFKPQFASKEAFLAYVDALNLTGDRIEYNKDGTATVRVSN
ncbi:MAG: amidohydrolase [Clostridia bacterium]|nr:amidohydrolase [Clostridia bacterium]